MKYATCNFFFFFTRIYHEHELKAGREREREIVRRKQREGKNYTKRSNETIRKKQHFGEKIDCFFSYFSILFSFISSILHQRAEEIETRPIKKQAKKL